MRLAKFFSSDIKLGHASAAVDARKTGIAKFLSKHGRTLAIAGGSTALTLGVIGAFPVLKTVAGLAGLGLLVAPQLSRIFSKIRSTLGIAVENQRNHAKDVVAEANRRGYAAQADSDVGIGGVLRAARDYSLNDLTSDENVHPRLPISRKTASAIGFGITAALTMGPLAPLALRAFGGLAEWRADSLHNVVSEARYQLENDLAAKPESRERATSSPAP